MLTEKAKRVLKEMWGPGVSGASMSFSQLDRCRNPTYAPKAYWFIGVASGSDYSGDALHRSNYEAMIEEFGLISVYGAHGSYGVIFTDEDVTEELVEALEGLDDYPIYDENHMSLLEVQLEDNAWEEYGRTGFRKALEGLDYGVDLDSELDELWANNGGNEASVIETGCVVYFDVDKVAKAVLGSKRESHD